MQISPAHSRSLIRIFTGRIWIANDAQFIHADNEDSDQTARKRSLIRVFVGGLSKELHSLTSRHIYYESVLNKIVGELLAYI